MKEQECSIREGYYARYLDKTPFLMYLFLSVTMVLTSMFIWPRLLIYTVIPVLMVNLVGVPTREDRFLVSVMNLAFALAVSMHFKSSKILA